MNDFKTFYDSLTILEKRTLRTQIAEISGKRENTVSSWLVEGRRVPKYEQTLIAQLLKKPLTELFPPVKKKEFVPTKW